MGGVYDTNGAPSSTRPRIRYGCFISYVHADGAFYPKFMASLEVVVRAVAEIFFPDNAIWIDRKRLTPGDSLETSIAHALCQSACVLVVYVPRYTASEWCLRELATALAIEQERRAILGDNLEADRGLVIPLVLRKLEPEGLPAEIQSRVWADFSKLSLHEPDLTQSREYVDQIEGLVRHIYRVYKLMQTAEEDGLNFCDGNVCHLRPPLRVPSIRPPRFPFRTMIR